LTAPRERHRAPTASCTVRATALLVLALAVAILGGPGSGAATTTIAGLAGGTSGTPDPSPGDPDSGDPSADDSRPAGQVTPIVRLVEQSAWVPPEGSFDLVLEVEGAPSGALLSVEIYPSVITRTGFTRSIAGDGLGSALTPSPPALPLSVLAGDAEGTVRASFPVSATTDPPFGVRLPAAGVYPVGVAITDAAGGVVDEFVTHLVRLPAAGAGSSLAFSLIAPVHATPSFQPDGQVDMATDTYDRLSTTIAALAEHPDVPLSVLPTPETVEALTVLDTQQGTGQSGSLRRSLTGRQTIATTFVELDLGSWATAARNDLETDLELTQQLVSGPIALARTTRSRPDGRAWVVDPTWNDDTLTRLRQAGVARLVIPESMLDQPPGTNSGSFLSTFDVLDGEGERISAVQADALLAERLLTTPDPVLNAHLVLADLAVLFFERPSIARGAVLSIPSEFPVPVATWDALLGSLGQTIPASADTLVEPVVLDQLFQVTDQAEETDGEVLVRQVQDVGVADASEGTGVIDAFADRAATTRSSVVAFASMVGPESGQPAELERLVLTAGALAVPDSERTAYLATVDRLIADQIDALVLPGEQQITLTDRTSQIPLSFENPLDEAIDIKIVLTSDRLDFPDGAEQIVTLPPAATTRVEVAVETRASGAFPLDVEVRSPDDGLMVGSVRLSVRSTAISGVGLVLSAVAGLFLLVWWARHFHKVRRSRRLVSKDHPTMRGATPTGAAEPSATLPKTAAERAAGEGNHVRSTDRH
jgi:hypothetical protein